MADERTRQMQAVCDAAVAWVDGASGAEQVLRSAVATWWEAEGKRLDAAMAEEREAAAREPEAPAPAPRVGQRWRRKATGEVWRVWHVGPERVGLALASGVGERGTSVALSELLAGDAWELVATPEPEVSALDQRIGGLIVGVKPPEPEVYQPAAGRAARDPLVSLPREEFERLTPISQEEIRAAFDRGRRDAFGEHEVAAPQPADERWQPGAVWDQHGRSRTVGLVFQQQGLSWVHFLNELGPELCDHMTHENGWRYVGRAGAPGQQAAQHDIPAAVRALIQDWAGRWADVARLARDRRDARGAVEDEARHDALTELVSVYEETTADGIPAGALDRFKLGPEYGEAQVRVFAEAGTALLAALNGPAAPSPEVQPPSSASEVARVRAALGFGPGAQERVLGG